MSFLNAAMLIIVALCAAPAWATDRLPPVEVVDTAVSAPDQVQPELFSGFSRQVSREALQRPMTRVSEALGDTTGVQVRQAGGYGGFTSVSMRGLGGKQLNVYLDGLLLNDPQSGSAELDLIPAAVLERIEVYPDFTPAQLASAGLGGALHLVTADLFEPRHEIGLTRGSSGAEQASLLVAERLADWHLLVGLNQAASDNDYDVLNDQGTLYNTGDDTEEPQHNAAFAQQSALLKAGTRPGEQRTLETLFHWRRTDKDIPAIDNNAVNDAALESEDWRGQFRLADRYGPLAASLRLFGGQRQDRYDDRNGTAGIGNEYVQTDEQQTGAAGILALDGGHHTATLNLEYRDETIRQIDRLTGRTALDNRRAQTLLAVQDDLFLLDDRLQFSAAVRAQHYRDDVDYDPARLQVFDNDTIQPAEDTETGASLGAQYPLTEQLQLKANLARQTRIPTLQERFGVLGYAVGNPELQPETSLNRDLGLVWETPAGRLSGVIYAKHLQDTIVTEVNGQGIARAANLAEADLRGQELDARWQAHARLALLLGATWLDSENHSAIKADDGKQLPGLYHRTLHAGTELEWRDWQWYLQYRFEDELFYDAANSVWPDARQTVETGWRWSREHWSTQFRIDNLLDERYQDYYRFSGPGRAYYFNLTANW